MCIGSDAGVTLADHPPHRPSGRRRPELQENPRVTTPTENEQGIWLTQEAHDRLKAELDQLVGNRPAMAAEINARREEGDLKENGGYHAAKDEQGKQEGRIRQLTDILRKANVGDAPTTADRAVTGTVITIRFQGDDETEKFLLGSREIAGTTELTVYSPESALGAAILGAEPGATVTYQAPNGRDITVDVVAIEPFVP
jgi:transcription elongation factor GreA